jgi:ActR/RegA family two-component response regulator
MATFKQILLRIVAVFGASGLGVIGAGAIANIPLWKAIMMAGIGGVATTVEALARGYMDDGKLDADEINAAFSRVDKKSK